MTRLPPSLMNCRRDPRSWCSHHSPQERHAGRAHYRRALAGC